MNATLADKNVMILAANGFDENQMTEMQRALIKLKATVKTVAPENGVVNGWQGAGWGHYFPVNIQIGEALGSDFDILVIPGGERGIAKLKTNLHSRRIVNHFLDAGKPVAAIGAGVTLLALSSKIAGSTVAAPQEMHDELTASGVIVGTEPLEISQMILTSNGEDIAAWVNEAIGFFADAASVRVAA